MTSPRQPRQPVTAKRIHQLAVDLAEFFDMTVDDAYEWLHAQLIGRHQPIHIEGDHAGGVHDRTGQDDIDG